MAIKKHVHHSKRKGLKVKDREYTPSYVLKVQSPQEFLKTLQPKQKQDKAFWEAKAQEYESKWQTALKDAEQLRADSRELSGKLSVFGAAINAMQHERNITKASLGDVVAVLQRVIGRLA